MRPVFILCKREGNNVKWDGPKWKCPSSNWTTQKGKCSSSIGTEGGICFLYDSGLNQLHLFREGYDCYCSKRVSFHHIFSHFHRTTEADFDFFSKHTLSDFILFAFYIFDIDMMNSLKATTISLITSDPHILKTNNFEQKKKKTRGK